MRFLALLFLLVITGVTVVPTSAKLSQLKLSNCHQTSTLRNDDNYSCNKAIDGNTNQAQAGQSCSHTNWEVARWKASTEGKAHIRWVIIYHSNDCCADSRNYFYVRVDNEPCAEYSEYPHTPSPKTVNCDKIGQEVMIKSMFFDHMALCEVQVFGELLRPKFDLKQLAIGCFEDSRERDLPALAQISRKMTVEKCLLVCQSREFKFAGLQAGTQCWCGQGFGKHDKATDDKCNRKCYGDSTQMCGGVLYNSVYATSNPNLQQLAIGCYQGYRLVHDSWSNRDLQTRVEYSNTTMTVEKCIRLCQWKKFKFAGLQNGTECWCGQDFGNYGRATVDKCNIKCTGDNRKMCGGVGYNSMYATAKAIEGNFPREEN